MLNIKSALRKLSKGLSDQMICGFSLEQKTKHLHFMLRNRVTIHPNLAGRVLNFKGQSQLAGEN